MSQQRSQFRIIFWFFFFLSFLFFCLSVNAATTSERVENQDARQDQRYPSIAQFNSNDRIVAWQSDLNGNGKWDIYARYNTGKEIRVNAIAGGSRTNPSVAMFSPTDAFVVWQSLNEDGNGWGIYGNRIKVSNANTGQLSLSGQPDFRINDFTNSNQMSPSVACSTVSTNSFCVVVWQSLNQDGSGYGIYAKQFRYSNNQLTPGTEFRVNTDTVNNQQNPRVTFFPNEPRYVITWDHVPDGDGSGIRFKISPDYFQGSGNNQVLPGNDLAANQRTAGNQLRPDVAALFNRQIVIAWKSQLGANTVVARLFDANGQSVTNDFTVATVTGTNLGYLSTTHLGQSGWAVVWQAQDGIFLKTYNGNGTQKTNSVKVNQAAAGTQPATPVIAGGGSSIGNHVVVAWESSTVDGSGYGISIREFDF